MLGCFIYGLLQVRELTLLRLSPQKRLNCLLDRSQGTIQQHLRRLSFFWRSNFTKLMNE